MRKQKIALVLIIFLATFLRFFNLGQNPPSLTWDEVAWGYNAYSLGIDGRDEFGRFLPLDYLESFGDFKPPVYAYLDVISVKLFGLNEFAVRFPSALLGTLTVLLTYFLTKRIFSFRYPPPRSPFGHLGGVAERLPRGETIALFSAFFLAISPWHINLSRAAFEANVATFFIVLGVWLFLTGVQGKGRYLTFSSVSFILSMYTFNTARIITPLLILLLAGGFRKEILRRKKEVILALVIGLMLIAPLTRFLLTPQAKLRFQEVNIFSDISVIEKTNQEIGNDNNIWWSKIIHNRRFAYAVEYLRHYFDNFNPGFLFIKGDGNPKFSIQDVGQMYLWDLPFFIAAILFLLRKKGGNWWVVPAWLLIGIIPAATARETPHALRIESTLPMFQILTALGVVEFLTWIKKIRIRKSFEFLLVIFTFSFLIFNFVYYFHGYYAHYPREFSGEWQYGYKESIRYVQSVQQNFDQIFVTSDLGRPYIYYLFYAKEDPRLFRKIASVKRDVFGFVTVANFGKYYFAKDLNISNQKLKILYINTSSKVPGNAHVLKSFDLLNGEPSLAAYML